MRTIKTLYTREKNRERTDTSQKTTPPSGHPPHTLTLLGLKSVNTGCTVCEQNNYIPLTTSGRGCTCWREICRDIPLRSFFVYYFPPANRLVEKNAYYHAFETPTGLWSIVLFALDVDHIRTGDFLLIPSDTETQYKPKPLVAPGPNKNRIALQ